jgi:ABC-type glycerol-3-phosphate transport system permease component
LGHSFQRKRCDLAHIASLGALIIAALIAILSLLLIFFTSLKTKMEAFSTTISILPKVWW